MNNGSVLTSPRRFPVLSVGISATTFDQAVAIISDWISRRERSYVNVCNVQTVLECHDSSKLSEIVNGSGLATPDGMPLVWIGRWLDYVVERVYGPDLMLALCKYGQSRGYRHFFYGGAPGVPERLAKNLSDRYPEIQIAGCYSPPFRELSGEEEHQIAEMVNAVHPDIVWVGLGTPKQDYWVAKFRLLLEAPVLIAVGAAFDFHSGIIKQAPEWMRIVGLEWLHRLIHDPRRLWKRYVFGNPRFLYLFLKQLLTRPA